MREQRLDRAVAQFIGGLLEPALDQVAALNRRLEQMRPDIAITTHAALCLESLQQLLNRGVLRRRVFRVELLRQFAHRRSAAVPKDLQDRELWGGDILGG